MQIKKDKIKNKLTQSAKEEFLEKGFEKASVRTIVKNAGTTIGNFYNYFSGKEEIFSEIVKGTDEKITRFVSHHNAEEEDPFALDDMNNEQAILFVRQALRLFSDSFIEDLILLTDCSKGTKYENSKATITEYIKFHFTEHKDIINPDYADDGISDLLARQFVEGIVSVLKQDIPTERKIDTMAEYLLFFIHGMVGILKK